MREFAEKGMTMEFRMRAVIFDALPLLIKLGTNTSMSRAACVFVRVDTVRSNAYVATVSWTKLTSRLPFTAMPKLYLELRPSLAHSCVTTVLEKPVLLTLVMKSCSTEEAMPWIPDPIKIPMVTELEYAKDEVLVQFELF